MITYGRFLGFEKDLGGIDGDALFLFLFQCIQEKRELEGLTLLIADILDEIYLAGGQAVSVGHQTSHQGGLAVIDMADNDQLHLLAGQGFFVTVTSHSYMYPRARSFCMA